jgi:hypothetical protein
MGIRHFYQPVGVELLLDLGMLDRCQQYFREILTPDWSCRTSTVCSSLGSPASRGQRRQNRTRGR